jgi:hypothetical protein
MKECKRCQQCSLLMATDLVACHRYLDVRTSCGFTPVHHAIACNRNSTIELLLSLGADPTTRSLYEGRAQCPGRALGCAAGLLRGLAGLGGAWGCLVAAQLVHRMPSIVLNTERLSRWVAGLPQGWTGSDVPRAARRCTSPRGAATCAP